MNRLPPRVMQKVWRCHVRLVLATPSMLRQCSELQRIAGACTPLGLRVNVLWSLSFKHLLIQNLGVSCSIRKCLYIVVVIVNESQTQSDPES